MLLLTAVDPSFAEELSIAMVLVLGMISLPVVVILLFVLWRIRTRALKRLVGRTPQVSDPGPQQDPWIESGRRLGRPEARGTRSPHPEEGEE